MEIHVPDKPLFTLKEVIVHLAIVTAGILIALSLEGILEWYHHDQLVREARANLNSEVRDNKKELDGVLEFLKDERKDLDHAREVVRILKAKRKVNKLSMQFVYHVAELRTASRTTAEVTAAFGYMDYDETKKYAGIYDLQAKFETLQDQTFKAGIRNLTFTSLMDKA